MYYVHYTPEFQEDMKAHSHADKITKIKARIERNQNLSGFEFFSSTTLIKKRIGNFRLIAKEHFIGADVLILFLKLVPRGGPEYESKFLKDWDHNTESYIARWQPYSDEQLELLLSELSTTAVTAKVAPSSHEELWLLGSHSELLAPENSELTVMETRRWVEEMSKPAIAENVDQYQRLLYEAEIYDLKASTIPAEGERPTLEPILLTHPVTSNYLVACLWFQAEQTLLLLSPFHHSQGVIVHGECRSEFFAVIEQELLKVRRALATNRTNTARLNALGIRSYPYLMTMDPSLWREIEKDKEANLALSPEETDILKSVNASHDAYPLFIDGRAGSGKSTMLQYLAANLIMYSLTQPGGLTPLYLTANSELLKTAQKIVMSILKTSHVFALGEREHMNIDSPAVAEKIRSSFQVFDELLLSIIPDGPDKRKLNSQRYVDFSGFIKLWESQFAKRPEAAKFNVATAWHVIRTYIKGMRFEHGEELTPDGFVELGSKRKDVSEETYKNIYNDVWLRWYKGLHSEGWWDSQDLAVLALNHLQSEHALYPAILCDESQDFTSVELEIIFQLSIFSRRTLRHDQLHNACFIFAGDPLQTLNPTGFRWESVKADFHDRFAAIMGSEEKKISIKHKPLHFNYRSNAGVVNICNSIQMLRSMILRSKDIRPQECWSALSPEPTVIFPLEEGLRGMRAGQNFVKLIPCLGLNEAAFVEADPDLRAMAEGDEDRPGIYRNIFGPMRAKGLEFGVVVLYRFGRFALDELKIQNIEDLAMRAEKGLSREDSLPIEYVFNRLYVAASRAKRRLIIVDDADAIFSFWSFVIRREAAKAFIARSPVPKRWSVDDHNPENPEMLLASSGRSVQNMGFVLYGTDAAWAESPADTRTQAELYYERGRESHDSYWLRQAAMAFRSTGMNYEALLSVALAYEYEGDIDKASELYRSQNAWRDVFRCSWRLGHFTQAWEASANDPSLAGGIEARAADFMHRGEKPDTGFIEGLLQRIRRENFKRELLESPTWILILRELIARTHAANDVDLARRSFPLLMEIWRGGAREFAREIASLSHFIGRYEDAIHVWESIGDIQHGRYYEAKARCTHFPEKLDWLLRERANDDPMSEGRVAEVDGEIMLGLRSLNHPFDFKPNQAKILFEVAIARAEAPLAASLINLMDVTVDLVDSFDRLVKLGNAKAEADALQALVARLASQREWSTLTSIADKASHLGPLLAALASSKELSESKSEELEKLLEKRVVNIKNYHGTPPLVIGTVIERVGKYTLALQFYEGLPESREIAERLVKNYERLAKYHEHGDQKKAAAYRRKADALRRSHDIGNKAIRELPAIRGIKVASLGEEEWVMGEFRIMLSEQGVDLRRGRQSVHILWSGGEWIHESRSFSNVKVDRSVHDLVRWDIPEWMLTAEVNLADGESLSIRCEATGAEFELRIPGAVINGST